MSPTYPFRVLPDDPEIWVEDFNCIKSRIFPNEENNLLLGNGFNMSVGIQTGSQQLCEALKESHEIQSSLLPSDVEKMKCTSNFDVEDFAYSLGKGGEIMRREVFKLIIKRTCILNHKVALMSFSTHFKFVFTTNYDPVIYRLFIDITKQNKPQMRLNQHTQKNDGFLRASGPRLQWLDPDRQNFFYLHGAFHIYSVKGTMYKRTAGERGLKQVLLEHVDNHISVFQVRDKETAIKKHKYLSYCYHKLSKMKGPLCIIGWRCTDKDSHLAKAIRQSPANPVFVSLHFGSGEVGKQKEVESDSTALEVIRNFRCHLHNKELVFFNASTVDYLR